jgi:hypothetical protein
LNAATYQQFRTLLSRVNKYLKELKEYQGADWGGDEIKPSQITGRTLHLIIPRGAVTQVQRQALEAARTSANGKGLRLIITEF